MSASGLAWRNRFVSAAVVGVALWASAEAVPDSVARAELEQQGIVALGFGHLLGALVFSRARRPRTPSARDRLWLLGPATWAASLALFLAYWFVFGPVLEMRAAFLLPFVAVNVWHIVENDLLLARSYGDRSRLGPLPRSMDHHLLAFGLTASLLLLCAIAEPTAPWQQLSGSLFDGLSQNAIRAAAAGFGLALLVRRPGWPTGLLGACMVLGAAGLPEALPAGRWLDPVTILAGVTFYHLVSWLVFFSDRSRNRIPGAPVVDGRRMWRRIAAVHVPVLVVAVVLLSRPEGTPKTAGVLLFSWASYLYWSVLHVVQTLVARHSTRPVRWRPRSHGAGQLAQVGAAWAACFALTVSPVAGTALWHWSGQALRPEFYVHPGAERELASLDLPELRALYDHRDGDPEEEYGIPFQEVSFPGAEGSTLRGWFVPGHPLERTVVVTVHGAWLDRRDFSRRLPFLHRAGYPVLQFDCREHGRSDGAGRGVTFGQRESRDVSAAAAFARETLGFDRVVAFGESQGAVAAILAAAADRRIDAVIAENPFATFDAARAALPGSDGIPLWLARPIFWAVERRIGFPEAHHPVDVIAQIAPRPILLMHGTEDHIIPFEHSRLLYGAAGEPKQLWIAPHALHNAIINLMPEEYARRVLGFLRQHRPEGLEELAHR